MDVFAADLSSQAPVRRLAAEVLDAYPHLDVPINNVGGLSAHRHVSTDGLEHRFLPGAGGRKRSPQVAPGQPGQVQT